MLELYCGVRFPVQRADVARFFILYTLGGLYADLDTFPNLDRFPQVPLGMCKMQARPIKTNRHKFEWKIEVVVAEKGDMAILHILEDLKAAMAEKGHMEYYNDKPCRFIYRTTGPVQAGRTLEARGYQPHVTVLSMCRPVSDLEKLITLDDTGRVSCRRSRMESYDVWSAFSMSYSGGNPLPPPPLARPLLQPLPRGQGRTRRWHFIKKPELRDPEVKELPSTAVVKPAATRPHQDDDEPMRRAFQEQLKLRQGRPLMRADARAAFADITDMFVRHRNCVSIEVTALRPSTQKFLRSI